MKRALLIAVVMAALFGAFAWSAERTSEPPHAARPAAGVHLPPIAEIGSVVTYLNTLPPPTTAEPPAASWPSAAWWYALAVCETGNNPPTDEPRTGYFGLEAGHPEGGRGWDAELAEAEAIYARSGEGAWGCAPVADAAAP